MKMYKCKNCNGVGVEDDVIQEIVAERAYDYLVENYGYLDMDNEDDLQKATDIQNNIWLDIERQVRDINFVEDDGICCPKCNGTGKVDWITNIMGGKAKSMSI